MGRNLLTIIKISSAKLNLQIHNVKASIYFTELNCDPKFNFIPVDENTSYQLPQLLSFSRDKRRIQYIKLGETSTTRFDRR